ncbi:MAG: nucleotidyltransferase domain-containing protein [Ignavibacteriae bacterium]|nr:nucleotidyltransferase domain-containing protein [Ignavibacteriota bacterium]
MNETRKFGLSAESLEWIFRVLRVFPEIDEAIIFGSRAKGNCKPGSDIDLAVKGIFPSYNFTERIRTMLEDGLNLPYFFNVVDYNKISNPSLKEHIDRVGRLCYKKGD